MRSGLQQILRRLPIARKLAGVVAVFVVIVLCLVLLAYVQLDVLAGVRAYVGGESLWSKGQKDAVHFLERYAATGDPADHRRFREALAVPLGDRRARLEMERPSPDTRVVTDGLVAGHNHPGDVPVLVRFYRHFGHVGHMAAAVEIWKLGDRYIAKLARLGETIHDEVSSGRAKGLRARLALAKVDALNDRLTPLEASFSRTLAEGARWVRDLLWRVTLAATAALMTIGLTFSLVILRHLREWEGKYRHLLETAGDAILVAHGETGVILEANRRAAQLLGLPVKQLIGMQQDAFHPEHTRDDLARLLADAEAQPSPMVELNVRRADGRIVPVELSAAVTELGGKPVVQSILREIGERRRTDAALSASRRRLEEEARVSAALARIGRELMSSLETPILLERLCQLTTEVLDCDTSETLLWRAKGDTYARVAAYGARDAGAAALASQRIPGELLSSLLAGAGHCDVADARLLDPAGGPGGWQLAMLLRRGQEIVGVQVASRDSERFTASERRIAEGIAYLASMALANARLVGEIERASRLKSEFVSTMSHELRTPLNVILGYTEMARDPALAAERDDHLVHIESAGRELLTLIESTLEVGRIDARRDEVRLEPVDLAVVWSRLGESCARLPRRPDVVLEWVDGTPGVTLVTDVRKLAVVVRNLVGNAVKFTERGSVRAEARVEGESFLMRVTDTGVGIHPKDQETIFDMFRQADGSDTRRFGGTGLGLYIVRRFVQQLGGTITLESAPGHGSTFTVALPSARLAPGTSRAA